MASYKINFSKSAVKELKRIDHVVVPRIIAAIEDLAKTPRPDGVRKLAGSQHTYRIRIGDYRVIYSIDDVLLIVGIERIRHRKKVYD